MPNPYAGYTDSTEVVANYVYTLLQSNAVSLGLDPAKGVMYGDQMLLPTTPCVCIVPGPRTRQYNGVGGRPVMNTFLTYVMVYYGKVQDQQANIHAGLTLAEQVEAVIHANITFGGLVIDSLCTSEDPGIARRGGALLDATRVTVQSRSKVVLNP